MTNLTKLCVWAALIAAGWAVVYLTVWALWAALGVPS